MINPFKKYKAGDSPSAKDTNRRGDTLYGLANSASSDCFIDSTGIHNRRRGFGTGGNIKIFEVQSAASGDAIYNCYEQILDGSEWTGTGGADKFIDLNSTSIEVFNINESDVSATYKEALAKYDLIQAWKIKGDDGIFRWAGTPLVTTPRLAITTEAAPAADHLTCNLIDRLGSEITSGLGSGIEVYVKMVNDTTLNTTEIRFTDDKYLFVQNIRGVWYMSQIMQGAEECECYVTP